MSGQECRSPGYGQVACDPARVPNHEREPGVMVQEFGHLRSSLESLEMMINSLEEKAGDILASPGPCGPEGDKANRGQSGSSVFCGELYSHSQRLDALTGRLGELRDRLEV